MISISVAGPFFGTTSGLSFDTVVGLAPHSFFDLQPLCAGTYPRRSGAIRGAKPIAAEFPLTRSIVQFAWSDISLPTANCLNRPRQLGILTMRGAKTA